MAPPTGGRRGSRIVADGMCCASADAKGCRSTSPAAQTPPQHATGSPSGIRDGQTCRHAAWARSARSRAARPSVERHWIVGLRRARDERRQPSQSRHLVLTRVQPSDHVQGRALLRGLAHQIALTAWADRDHPGPAGRLPWPRDPARSRYPRRPPGSRSRRCGLRGHRPTSPWRSSRCRPGPPHPSPQPGQPHTAIVASFEMWTSARGRRTLRSSRTASRRPGMLSPRTPTWIRHAALPTREAIGARALARARSMSRRPAAPPCAPDGPPRPAASTSPSAVARTARVPLPPRSMPMNKVLTVSHNIERHARD